MGLGTLAKGPVAIALTRRRNIYMVDLGKRWKEIFHGKYLLAGIIMFAVALPWYLLVDKATNGEWTKGSFYNITSVVFLNQWKDMEVLL